MAFASIPEAIRSFANGEFLIVLDHADRENEGDLIIAASDFTPEKAAFMIRHTSGYLCAPIKSTLASRLNLPQMVSKTSTQDPQGTAYTISIDAAISNTTGISAVDRSRTCRFLADPTSTAETFRRPGHILPLEANGGGVRVRAGHTEATVEFCRLAGKELVGVLAELVEGDEDLVGRAERKGTGMMKVAKCLEFGERYGIRVVTIDGLKGFLERNPNGVTE